MPTTLEGRFVRLMPLTLNHVGALNAVGLNPELWRWTLVNITSEAEMRQYVETALMEQEKGLSLPFVTTEKSSGIVVGCTRFMNIDRHHLRLEIGSTWVAPAWQRTHVNTEAKYLMLRHAFENLHCHRVELKTDSLNEKSRKAILRIGAKEEGTLRNHMVTQNGRLRHSVYFSIIDTEWPDVKTELEKKLNLAG